MTWMKWLDLRIWNNQAKSESGDLKPYIVENVTTMGKLIHLIPVLCQSVYRIAS